MTQDRVTAILYSLLATRLRSLVIILPIHLFTITRVHICNRVPILPTRMPISLKAGVRALTLCCFCLNVQWVEVIPADAAWGELGRSNSWCIHILWNYRLPVGIWNHATIVAPSEYPKVILHIIPFGYPSLHVQHLGRLLGSHSSMCHGTCGLWHPVGSQGFLSCMEFPQIVR